MKNQVRYLENWWTDDDVVITLTSHLWGLGFKPRPPCGKAGSCLAMVSSLHVKGEGFSPRTKIPLQFTCATSQRCLRWLYLCITIWLRNGFKWSLTSHTFGIEFIKFLNLQQGARWPSGNTLASHLGSVPGTASSGKAGCWQLAGSLQYRTLTPTLCTGFLCPSNYPSWYDLYSVESDVKPQINK